WKLLKSTLKQEKDENAPSPLLRPNPRIVISEDGQAANTHPTTKRDKFAPIDYNSGGYVVNCRSSTARNFRSRAIRISFQLVAAYIICWLPYNGLSLYQYVDPQGFFEAHVNKVYCLHSIMVFNAVINPYLYGLFGNFLPQKRTGQN
ncbi:unnamed protein product, partial [Onchocerca flexuosa]|uniref:G_PROTEIN_RECEP_F1_2 domain-containing protein n=1 Tax=Onchocerca flexuosa TaxID=387005 RepID=A0A183H9H9_9BILA